MSIKNSVVPRTIQRLYEKFKSDPEIIDDFIYHVTPAIEKWNDEKIDQEFVDYFKNNWI